MQRERDKKRKADEKRQRRLDRKKEALNVTSVGHADEDLAPTDVDEQETEDDISPDEPIGQQVE